MDQIRTLMKEMAADMGEGWPSDLLNTKHRMVFMSTLALSFMNRNVAGLPGNGSPRLILLVRHPSVV